MANKSTHLMVFVRIEWNNYCTYHSAWHRVHSQQTVASIIIPAFNITLPGSYYYFLYLIDKESVLDNEYKNI